MQIFAALLALPLIMALPACPPESSSATPSPSPTTKPPVSYSGRRLLFQTTYSKCMIAKGNYVGAKVGLSTDCINEVPAMHWDTGPPGTVGEIRLHDTDLCLDAGDWNSRGDGVKITLQKCGQGAGGAQQWWYSINSRVELAGPFLRSHSPPQHSNLCLDLTDGNPSSQLQTWTCYADNMNQKWDLPPWCVHC